MYYGEFPFFTVLENLAIQQYFYMCLRDHPSQMLMIKCLTIIQIELEFGNVGFWGEGKTGVPGENPLGAE